MSASSGESITQFPAKKKQWLPFTTNEEVIVEIHNERWARNTSTLNTFQHCK